MKTHAAKAARTLALALMCAHAVYIAYLPARAADLLIGLGVSGATVRQYSFRNDVSGPLYDGFAIAFTGVPGLALALAQVALIQTALVLVFSVRYQNRRFGWMALCAMSALWAGNLVYFSLVGGFDYYWPTLGAHALGLVATVVARPRKRGR